MFKSVFLWSYLGLGAGALLLGAFCDLTGFLLPTFGTTTVVDTASRQGYWYTYRRTQSSSGPSSSPGSRGGYSGGGYSGGK
jgi:hypothetical protein